LNDSRISLLPGATSDHLPDTADWGSSVQVRSSLSSNCRNPSFSLGLLVWFWLCYLQSEFWLCL